MLTFHEPDATPSPWMTGGQLGAYPAIGTQVRARVTDAGIEVGAFPPLGAGEVFVLAAMLAAWRGHGPRTATCAVVGVYGNGPTAAWGPAFASRGGDAEVDELALVHALLAYLRHVVTERAARLRRELGLG